MALEWSKRSKKFPVYLWGFSTLFPNPLKNHYIISNEFIKYLPCCKQLDAKKMMSFLPRISQLTWRTEIFKLVHMSLFQLKIFLFVFFFLPSFPFLFFSFPLYHINNNYFPIQWYEYFPCINSFHPHLISKTTLHMLSPCIHKRSDVDPLEIIEFT